MLAARAVAEDRGLRLAEIPEPAAGEGDVVVRVRSVGVSRGLLALWNFPHQVFPTTPGHEMAGEVHALGPGVRDLAVGQRVRVRPSLPCGRCVACTEGRPQRCADQATIGYACFGSGGRVTYERYHDGGLAELVRVPASAVVPLPDHVPFDVAAKIGTLAGVYRAWGLASALDGPVVVCAAGGASGSAALALAGLAGAGSLVAVGRRAGPLAAAARRSPVPIDTIATDDLPAGWEAAGGLTERLRELTGPAGPAAVLDFVPSGSATTEQAILSMRDGGTAVLCGGNHSELRLKYVTLMRRRYVLRGHRGAGAQDEEQMTRLVDDRLRGLVTHRFPLRDVGQAVSALLDPETTTAFVVVDPHGSEDGS